MSGADGTEQGRVRQNLEQPGKIREKIREVFHCEVPLDDERLVERFRVTATGDLIMKFR